MGFYVAAGALFVASVAVCGVADLLSLPLAANGYCDYFFCCRNFFQICDIL